MGNIPFISFKTECNFGGPFCQSFFLVHRSRQMELTKRRKRGSCWQLPSTLPLVEMSTLSHPPPQPLKTKTKNPTNKKALTNKLKRRSRRQRVTWQQPSPAAHLTASECWECHRDLALPYVCHWHSWGVYIGTT